MEYLASGALSREHYALVNSVEQAVSPQQADSHLAAEVERIKRKLADRQRLSPAKCYEYLILLLYCVTASTITPSHRDIAFAMTHAVNLAETGETLRQRRTGYIFCASVMQPGDELMLMLVNTIRKDLESKEAARIAAGLDALISLPREDDVVPAVQDSLLKLIGHNSPTIRQRALHTTRLLKVSRSKELASSLTVRLREAHESVVHAALLLVEDLYFRGLFSGQEAAQSACEILRLRVPAQVNSVTVRASLKVMRMTLGGTLSEGLVDDMLQTVLEVLQLTCKASADNLHPTALESFRTLGAFQPSVLARGLRTVGHPLHNIRHLLMAQDATSHYSFLVCLQELHPDVWAGTGEYSIPPILDELDVQAIIRLLDADDAAIRRATHGILYSVDPHILHSFADNLENQLKLGDEHGALRILEVARILEPDGESYARRVGGVLARIEQASKGKGKASVPKRAPIVFEQVVESILVHLKDKGADFAAIFTTTMLGAALLSWRIERSDADAIICGCRTPLPPQDVVCAMAGILQLNPVSIQEALLIAMIRVVVDCDSVPSDSVRDVKELAGLSGRHIRKRCGQYLSLSSDLESLRSRVNMAKSSSLPDFLMAIETAPSTLSSHQSPLAPNPKSITSPRSPTTELPKPASKLRYSAYEPPPVPSLVRQLPPPKRMPSDNSSLSSVSSHSEPQSHSYAKRAEAVQDVDDLLSRTLTAGDLILAAEGMKLNLDRNQPGLARREPLTSSTHPGQEFRFVSLDSPFITEPPSNMLSIDNHSPFAVNDTMSRKPSVDSPFRSEPTPLPKDEFDDDPFKFNASVETEHLPTASNLTEPEFELLWSSITKPKTSGRGWCESSVTEVFEHIRTKGFEMRTVASDTDGSRVRIAFSADGKDVGALRLRTGDDGVCLWGLRCSQPELKAKIETELDI
ncbi:ARM repeat-containing protein [Auriculariales sp. MPI-PUGE-AT-0066]|nr:ARM repeat-containing protein [Auriculariales sp. MPI-PUGE-AT-0066]